MEPRDDNATDAKSNDKNYHSDAESSNEGYPDSGADAVAWTAWDRHFLHLERYMNYAYPNGGYIVAADCPRELRGWILQQRIEQRNRELEDHNSITAKNI